MQISMTSLFNAIKEDPKQTKELLKSSVQKDLMQLNSANKSAQSASFKNADKLLDSLFSKLSNGTMSKNEAVKTIQNSVVFKQNSSSMEGMKNLLTLVSKEPKLSRFVAPLKEFVQHISTSNASTMNQQVKNSGVGLEANLAKATLPTKLPPTTKTLLTNILKELNTLTQKDTSKVLEQNIPKEAKLDTLVQNTSKEAKPNTLEQNIPKETKLKNNVEQNAPKEIKPNAIEHNTKQNIMQTLKEEIKTLLSQKTVFKEDLASIQKKLTKTIENLTPKESLIQEEAPNTPKELKTLLNTLDKLSKTPHTSKQEISEFVKQVAKELDTLRLSITSEKVANKPEVIKLQTVLKEVQTLLKHIDNTPLTPQDKQVLATLITQPNVQNSLPTITNATNLNIQEKLQLLTLKLKQSMEILDKRLPSSNKSEAVLKNFAQTLQKEMPKIASQETLKNPPLQTLEKDIKQTLSKLSDATSSATSQNQKEIHTLANKSLTNIQMHQLISYAQSSLSTYIPYAWDELKDGKIAFKKAKEDSFYCQIDVELKRQGKINMMLMLTEDKYLNISIATEQESFKEIINENLPLLKSALYKVGLTPLHLHVKPLEKNIYSEEEWSDFSLSLKV